jgi:anti-sigma regulatory factor (Ser/Thr protein kinase)
VAVEGTAAREAAEAGVEFVRRGIPGDAARLAEVRRELLAWASTLGLPAPDVDGVVMASYEALANAAEHAYGENDVRVVDLFAAQHDGCVQVVVKDFGMWRPAAADPGFRGRGLLMIRKLAHESDIDRGPGGTTVRMLWRLPANR